MNYLLLIVCCVSLTSFARAGDSGLLVSAAASLRDPLTELARDHGVTFNFGGSGALQHQIENGAPVDVFISAATQQMDALADQGLLLPNSRRDLLRNELVLIAPRGSALHSFADLSSDAVKKIALGEPKSVPVGAYAAEVLTKLKLLETLRKKFVYAADVRQVLGFVASGNADAGIVYITDAKISDKVQIVETAPTGSHAPIVYPIAVIKASAHRDLAEKYLEQLSSPTAAAVFERYGFIVAH